MKTYNIIEHIKNINKIRKLNMRIIRILKAREIIYKEIEKCIDEGDDKNYLKDMKSKTEYLEVHQKFLDDKVNELYDKYGVRRMSK